MAKTDDVEFVFHAPSPVGLTFPEPLSFRDQCAIAAMQALITIDPHAPMPQGEVAREAFVFADAMNAERQKRSQP